MREIRQSGSEGGGTKPMGRPYPYRSQPPHHCLAIIRSVPTGRPAVLSGVFTLLSLRVCHCLVAAVLPSHHHPLHSRRRTSSVCASARQLYRTASRHKRYREPPRPCLAITRSVPTGRPAVLSGVFTLLSLRVCHCLVAAVRPSHQHPLRSRRRTSSAYAPHDNCIARTARHKRYREPRLAPIARLSHVPSGTRGVRSRLTILNRHSIGGE